MKKVVLTAQGLLDDSYRLAEQVLKDGFTPTMIVAIWRGGTPVGMAVQEFIRRCGVTTDHIAIRTSAYAGVDKQLKTVSVFGMSYIVNTVSPEDRLLIVDDIFDTGRSVDAVINELEAKARGNTPGDIRIATPWYKPSRNQTNRTPHYWVHESEDWVVFPHELDLSEDEMRDHRPELHALFAAAKRGGPRSG